MATSDKPNILYILSDQHKASALGFAGDAAADTPQLDRLASGGTSFERAYCPSPVCLPSRMSMLTGRRPHEQSCWTNDDILDSAIPTWLHGLGAAGYHPRLVGRMHSMGPDQLRGAVARPIGDHSSAWPGLARRPLGVLAGTSGPNLVSIEKSGAGHSSYQSLDTDVKDEAVRYLEKHAAENTGKPFALAVGFMLPHAPYVASKADIDAVGDRVPPPSHPTAPNDEHAWIRQWRLTKKLDTLTQEDVHRARVAYYALVRELDRNIGAVLDALDRLDLARNTIVVYLSDHGDHIGERGLFWKHTLYDESIRVPLVMRWPDHIQAGAKIKTPVETGGLGNTILDLVGADTLPNSTMQSFSPLFSETSPPQGGPVYSEYCLDGSTGWAEGLKVTQRAVIDGGFKLIYTDGLPSQLFNLETDPHETQDLREDAEHAETVSRLTALVLNDWNPVEIRDVMKKRARDVALLKKWAENTTPQEPTRWQVRPEQNELAE